MIIVILNVFNEIKSLLGIENEQTFMKRSNGKKGMLFIGIMCGWQGQSPTNPKKIALLIYFTEFIAPFHTGGLFIPIIYISGASFDFLLCIEF